MKQIKLLASVSTFLIAMASAHLAWAQNATSKTTVREETRTVRETVTTTHGSSRTADHEQSRLVAIFIKNRAGKEFDNKLGALEDLVIAGITDMGFQVISLEDSLKAVRSFLGIKLDQSVPGAKLDELLEYNTSAVRLAQNMGVDYLFIVSVATFGTDHTRLNRPDLGINRKIATHKLRVVYKILDAGRGESISAGTILSQVKTQISDGLTETTDWTNDLLADAATKIAEILREKGGTAGVADSKKTDSVVEFTVTCSVQDLSVPEARKDETGGYILTANRYKLEALNVTVELDGLVVGTAPGMFNALPGIHKMRLSRKGFEDWEGTVNIHHEQALSVAMTLSSEGRKNWLAMSDFFGKLKRDERLAEADAELIKGYAQMMRQSGMRIQDRSDVKIRSNDAQTVNLNKVTQQNISSSVWPH